MQRATLKEIKKRVLSLHKEGKTWHFHILTPTCRLNEKVKYAFILEYPKGNEAYVHYSDQAEKRLGKQLAPLLHGSKILNKEATDKDYQHSKIAKKIIDKAQALNQQNIEWHHHVLFPGCIFNAHSQKYTLLLENPKNREVLESLSDEEPTNDLKQLERLFYQLAP